MNDVDAPVAGFTSVPCNVPLVAPAPTGENVIVTVHVLGDGVVLQSVFVIVNGEPGTRATFMITVVCGPDGVASSVTDFGAAVAPTDTLPKSSGAGGANVTAAARGASAIPAVAAIATTASDRFTA